MEKVQVLIIGAGMAGLSAAIWCERLGLSYLVIEGAASVGGQISQIKNRIWDFPPGIYANGDELLFRLNQHEVIAKSSIRRQEQALHIDLDKRFIHTTSSVYHPDYVIMATGIRQNRLPALAHASRVLAPWFSTTSQAHSLAGQKVLVIGGGDRAVESAINLAAHADQVWVSVRSSKLRARDEWQKHLRQCTNVKILFNTQLFEVLEAPRPTVVLTSSDAKTTQSLEVDWILPRIGVTGNSELLPSVAKHGGSFFRVNEVQQTELDWIYAIGDVTNGPEYGSLSLASGQAMKAVKHISLQRKE